MKKTFFRTLVICAALTGALLLWASVSSGGMSVLHAVVLNVRKLSKAHRLGQTRDPQCRYLDGWRELFSIDSQGASRQVEAQFLHLDSDGKNVQIKTPHGNYWIPERDKHALADMLVEQENSIYESPSVSVHPDDVVLDCGA